MARAFLDRERDVVGRDDAAEVLLQPLRLKHRGHWLSRLRAKRARTLRCSAFARSVIFAVTGRMCGRAIPSTRTSATVKMMLCMKPSFSTVQMPKMPPR